LLDEYEANCPPTAIGTLLQNTFGILPGVLWQNTKGDWYQNTLQTTQGILQGILVLSTLGI
jgi:hypothetical protein